MADVSDSGADHATRFALPTSFLTTLVTTTSGCGVINIDVIATTGDASSNVNSDFVHVDSTFSEIYPSVNTKCGGTWSGTATTATKGNLASCQAACNDVGFSTCNNLVWIGHTQEC